MQKTIAAYNIVEKMSEMSGIKSIRGFIASPLSIEVELIKMAQHYHIQKETYGEIYDELVVICNMNTREEIKDIAHQFINEFVDKFGHNALKVLKELYLDNIGDQAYYKKYYKIAEEYMRWSNEWAQQKFQYNIEAFIFGTEVIQQTKHYGLFIIPIGNEYARKHIQTIFHIVEEIRFHFYNENEINKRVDELKDLIDLWGHPYYCQKDLKDPQILKELFIELGEELGEREAFLGHEIFYDYDGYGNILNHKGEIYEQW